MSDTLLMGAVAYDPKVVTIWDGFKEFFAERDLDFDYVLYSNYERQVQGHFAGQYHVAWNSPLAWIQADRVAKARGRTARAVAMRDTDCDLTSLIVVKADSGNRVAGRSEGQDARRRRRRLTTSDVNSARTHRRKGSQAGRPTSRCDGSTGSSASTVTTSVVNVTLLVPSWRARSTRAR